jgi:hypothetical protein
MNNFRHKTIILALVATTALVACQNGTSPFAAKPRDSAAANAAAPSAATTVKLVDRDIEAPEIFQDTADALWDGRPSLGGVWVASPDTKDPERVILRNTANGKFVIGALFRRERDNPGPKLQISSDAAAALGLLAGEPGKVSVTALRREEGTATAPDASKPMLDAVETVDNEALDGENIGAAAVATLGSGKSPVKGDKAPKPAIGQDAVVATALPPVAPANGKATDTAVVQKPAAAAAPLAPVAPVVASGAGKPIQIGFFSVEANAKRAAEKLGAAGLTANIRKEESQGKTYWSVTARGDGAALAKAKAAGFADAYFLKG